MKKKTKKNKLDKKMMTPNNRDCSSENPNKENFTTNSEEQNNNYPLDIQGLFERLGIE